MEITNILFKKLDDGTYTDPNNRNQVLSAELIEEQMKQHELPGGVKLYYNNDGDVCCKFNIPE